MVYSVFGIPFYGLYPDSLMIFGDFGLFLCVTKDRANGLLIALAAGTMFDMLGTATAFKHPDISSFIFWITPVFLAFVLTKTSITRFVWSRPFLAFLVFDVFIIKFLPINDNTLSDMMEMATEALWCAAFYFSFYRKDFSSPIATLAPST